MSALQPARGTQDLLPEAARRHRRVSETAREQAELYGFAELATPIFEFTEVFARPIGEHTDIVSKEMYTFTDRGGDEVTLRPENTAGVVRAVLSNGLTQSTPLKFFYSGPMFRYERPQKGRFRQFHQIGVELLGVAQPQADIEIIALGHRILKALGIADRVVLELNTLGDPESRAAYRDALVAYFSARRPELSEDSQRRLDTNPLRILDSKDPGDIQINAEAPTFHNFLNNTSRDFFLDVRAGLDRLEIKYTMNPHLVRGLDYYTHTVFEFVTTDLGAQGTVLAGGRYDGLVELMGGPSMPGVGWAAGIERLAMLIDEPPAPARPVALVPIGSDHAEATAVVIAEDLRDAGLVVDLAYSGNLQRRMRRADRIGARAAVLLGEDEIAAGTLTLRDLDSGEQTSVRRDELAARLKAMVG
jgi:histidyl-tRNA synthetase